MRTPFLMSLYKPRPRVIKYEYDTGRTKDMAHSRAERGAAISEWDDPAGGFSAEKAFAGAFERTPADGGKRGVSCRTGRVSP